MRGKLFASVSWFAFLVSALAEWGFDIDLPLTPTLWLAIAVCGVLVTYATRTTTGTVAICAIAGTAVVGLLSTRHDGVCGGQHHRHHCPPVPHTRLLLQWRAKPGRTKDDTSPRLPIESGIAGCACLSSWFSAIQTMTRPECETLRAMVTLNPATTRGPPRCGEKQAAVPTPPLRVVSRSSQSRQHLTPARYQLCLHVSSSISSAITSHT